MVKNKILDTIALNYLDGKKAFVESGGLRVTDRLEGDVWLRYTEHYGIVCEVPLRWNDSKAYENLMNLISFKEVGIDNKEVIDTKLDAFAENFRIQISSISMFNVKNFKVVMDKDILYSLTIIYNNNSTVEIRLSRNQK